MAIITDVASSLRDLDVGTLFWWKKDNSFKFKGIYLPMSTVFAVVSTPDQVVFDVVDTGILCFFNFAVDPCSAGTQEISSLLRRYPRRRGQTYSGAQVGQAQ